MQLLIILHGRMMKLLISLFCQLLYEHLFQLSNQTVPEETSYSLTVDTEGFGSILILSIYEKMKRTPTAKRNCYNTAFSISSEPFILF